MSVYNAVYGSYYEYQLIQDMKDYYTTQTIAIAFILAFLTFIIFSMFWNRNT